MGLYDSDSQKKPSQSVKIPLKEIFMIVAALSVLGGGYFAYKKITPTSTEVSANSIKPDSADAIEAFKDEELINVNTAQQQYKSLRKSFVVVLGKLASYKLSYKTELSQNDLNNVSHFLKRHTQTIKAFQEDFHYGQNEAYSEIETKVIQNGVEKSLGKKSVEEAKKEIEWLMTQGIKQESILLSIRDDLNKNPTQALKTLREITSD